MPKVCDGDGGFSNTSSSITTSTTGHKHVTDCTDQYNVLASFSRPVPTHMAYGLMPCVGQEVWWVQPKRSASDHD